MNFDPNNEESAKRLIKLVEHMKNIYQEQGDVITFESYDEIYQRPVILTYYEKANPIKLSIKIHLDDKEQPKVAAYNEKGERIEDIIEPY